MGMWTPRLDSGECFYGLRQDWRIWREHCETPAQSTRAIIAENAPHIRRNPYKQIFWMMLAHIQWRDGCLQSRVKERALKVIADGPERVEWFTTVAMGARRKEYQRLYQQITSKMPPPMPFGQCPLQPTGARVGDMIQVFHGNRPICVLHVLGLCRDNRARVPLCAAFDWSEVRPPSFRELVKMDPLTESDEDDLLTPWCLLPSGARFRPYSVSGLTDRFSAYPGVRLHQQATSMKYRSGWVSPLAVNITELPVHMREALRGR
ncbi:MAG TPA: hypothetical protein VHN77_00875 [Phycisphaerales bacterium]|nr:hypothetical protein [Phycisphaerales bacterium]